VTLPFFRELDSLDGSYKGECGFEYSDESWGAAAARLDEGGGKESKITFAFGPPTATKDGVWALRLGE
jgi:hypothetical protein